jgi:hypothetical protein
LEPATAVPPFRCASSYDLHLKKGKRVTNLYICFERLRKVLPSADFSPSCGMALFTKEGGVRQYYLLDGSPLSRGRQGGLLLSGLTRQSGFFGQPQVYEYGFTINHDSCSELLWKSYCTPSPIRMARGLTGELFQSLGWIVELTGDFGLA